MGNPRPQRRPGRSYRRPALPPFHRLIERVPVRDVDQRAAAPEGRERWRGGALPPSLKESAQRGLNEFRHRSPLSRGFALELGHDRVVDDERRLHMEFHTTCMAVRPSSRFRLLAAVAQRTPSWLNFGPMSGALTGLRVLDLADQSGALAGRLLAGLGADVVLVEPPAGSPLRRIPPFFDGGPEGERSLFFWFYAAGKRSLVLDPAADSALLDRLAARADVLIETGPPGGTAALRAAHPRLVVASITPFGQAGPYRDWRSSDLVAQAMGGMLAVSGFADGPPLHSLGLQAYHQAGVLAATGVLAALLARDRTGRGQHVDVSLQAAVAGALEHVPGLS